MNPQIKSMAEWIEDQADRLDYGEVSLCIIIHDGNIKRIERTVTEKLLADQH